MLVSSPNAVYGGVVANNEEERQALLAEAKRLAGQLRVDYLELRHTTEVPSRTDSELQRKDLYFTFEHAISTDEDALMKTFPRDIRTMIRKGSKNGLTAQLGREELLDEFYEVYATSLRNLGVERIDLQQLHVWSDAWADDESWRREVERLKAEGLIGGFGISVNRWEPANVLRALETGLVDAVQVVYNIFDRTPEDELFPACRARGVAVIARVPFDEGSLTGTLTAGSTWPDGDFRNMYFTPDNLRATLARVEALERDLPDGMPLPDAALRFILESPDVSTIIPGMRKAAHVDANMAASDGSRLGRASVEKLRSHRWDRGYDVE